MDLTKYTLCAFNPARTRSMKMAMYKCKCIPSTPYCGCFHGPLGLKPSPKRNSDSAPVAGTWRNGPSKGDEVSRRRMWHNCASNLWFAGGYSLRTCNNCICMHFTRTMVDTRNNVCNLPEHLNISESERLLEKQNSP